jgi:hypothetical protein
LTGLLSSEELATASVRSLRGIVPDRSGVGLSAEGGTVRIIDSVTSPVLVDLSTFGVAGRLTPAEAVTAVAAVLSTVQDVVCEALTDPWPRTEAGGLALPEAGVERGWIIGRFVGAAKAGAIGATGGTGLTVAVVPVPTG